MADSLLEEQLERIRRLTERMSQFENRSAELSHELARDRESAGYDPLHEIRDFRVLGQDAKPIAGTRRRATANDRPTRSRRRK